MNLAGCAPSPGWRSGGRQGFLSAANPPPPPPLPRPASTGPLPRDDRRGRREEDLDVGPERARPGVSEVEADHLVEGRAAAPANLPESCDPRLGLQDPAAMPRLVLLELVL